MSAAAGPQGRRLAAALAASVALHAAVLASGPAPRAMPVGAAGLSVRFHDPEDGAGGRHRLAGAAGEAAAAAAQAAVLAGPPAAPRLPAAAAAGWQRRAVPAASRGGDDCRVAGFRFCSS